MKFRTLLLGLSKTFSLPCSMAFFSVSGLSKLFAGATFSVILMKSSLEIKLITGGYLYNYWEKINKVFRWYLVTGVVILVLITSLGIYGFLTSNSKIPLICSQQMKNKKHFYNKKKSSTLMMLRYDEELERISNNISTLSNARSQQIQVRDTSVVGES